MLTRSIFSLLCCLPLCSSVFAETSKPPAELYAGGHTTVFNTTRNAFSLPAANLSLIERSDFSVGNAFFKQPWVTAPATTTARDGLGPLFNANACQSCHVRDGRGHPPAHPKDNTISMLMRLSIPAQTPEQQTIANRQGSVPEPTYGGQFQDRAIQGVPAEGRVKVTYTEQVVKFADGETVSLRQPTYQFEDLQYGAMRPDTLHSPRVAQPMIGLGLIEAIPETALLANADAEDSNNDGISGRPNPVWSISKQQTVIGRFGWKANMPDMPQQAAGAFSGDIGITSHLFPEQSCTSTQTPCVAALHGEQPEVSDEILAFVVFYARHLGVPARRNLDDPVVQQGQQLFMASQCASCHTPHFQTGTLAGNPAVSNQSIYPYSDFLLHDMGDGLADNRPDYAATGREWRTQPLWGIGLTATINGHTQFLHDGRARNLLEAILWHGGEAKAAKQSVLQMTRTERDALLRFLDSL